MVRHPAIFSPSQLPLGSEPLPRTEPTLDAANASLKADRAWLTGGRWWLERISAPVRFQNIIPSADRLRGYPAMHDVVPQDRATATPLVASALQRSLQSWDGLLEWLPIGIYTCDRDGLLVHYNRRVAELWGRSPMPGDPRFRFCGAYQAYQPNGEPLPLAEAPMAELLRTGEPIRDRELVVERPDGSRLAILANLDPLFGPGGEIVGGVNCFQDITARKQAEALLEEHERHFAELLAALPAAVYTTDAAGRITFYNQAAVELWGRQPEPGDEHWCGSWRLYWPDGT